MCHFISPNLLPQVPSLAPEICPIYLWIIIFETNGFSAKKYYNGLLEL
jgi:hypothetical protein